MGSKTILLIEDNVDDEQLVRRALQKNNVMNEVVVACDGEEAISRLFPDKAEGAVRPDLIILDLNLPGMSGLQVLQRIRREDSTRLVPVVVVTSSATDSATRDAYEAGASSFVIKPTDAVEFGETFLNISMYWLLLNVVPDASGLVAAR